jgi:hypothetical protein
MCIELLQIEGFSCNRIKIDTEHQGLLFLTKKGNTEGVKEDHSSGSYSYLRTIVTIWVRENPRFVESERVDDFKCHTHWPQCRNCML